MRAKKIVNQSSDFPVRRTGSYRQKKALTLPHTLRATWVVLKTRPNKQHDGVVKMSIFNKVGTDY